MLPFSNSGITEVLKKTCAVCIWATIKSDSRITGACYPNVFGCTIYIMFSARLAALPWLYLKGISSGEMGEALKVLVEPEATGLSASTVSRLKQAWAQE